MSRLKSTQSIGLEVLVQCGIAHNIGLYIWALLLYFIFTMLCASCAHCHFIVFSSGWQVSRRALLVFMGKHLRHLRTELTWHKGSNLNYLQLDLFHHINIQISVNASVCTHTERLTGAFMLRRDEEM